VNGSGRDRGSLALGFVIAVVYAGLILPIIGRGAEDIRMASVFSIDEADIAAEVRRLLRSGFFELPSFKYGGIFYYVPLLFLNVWSLFGDVTDGLILIAVRSFGAVSGAGCLWMTWRLGNLVFDQASGWIASLLLLLSPVFLRWSIESHPDLPQLFFLLCGLYYALLLCGKYETRALVLSSVFAGLAFGTKYSGVFLLPVIVLSVLLPEDGMLRPGAVLRRLKTMQIWWVLLMIPVVFCVTVAVTNPYMILEFESFRKSLLMEKGIMGFGHSFRVDTGAAVWLEMLWGLLGKVHGTVLLVTLLFWMWYLVKGKFGIPASKGMLVLWMAMFVVYLMLEVNLRRSRHLLPVLPCGLLVVGYAYTEIWGKLRRRVNAGWVWAIPVLLLLSWDHVSSSTRLFGDRWVRVGENEELPVGEWLAANYPAETTILYDAYSYVPATFGNVFRSFGTSYPMVAHFEPDLVIIRDAISRDYLDKNNAVRSRRGESHYLERHYFYEFMKAGLVPDYSLIRRFNTISVFWRTSKKIREGPDEHQTWLKLAKHFYDGRIHGKVTAGWTMGHMFLSLRLEEEAQREFQDARTSNNFAVRIFNHGRRALKAGRLLEAKHAFEEALGAAASRSDSYLAGMRSSLASQYFETGHYEEAIVQGEAALVLDEGMPEAHFLLASSCLAMGLVDRARDLFALAASRFGPQPVGSDRLRTLIGKGVREPEARELLKRFYGVSPLR
jgi:tetratricopeptide (TPR) repeat protein